MAAFDAMIEAGKAVLEGRAKPAMKVTTKWNGHGAIGSSQRARAVAGLLEEARSNPAVHVSLRAPDGTMQPIYCNAAAEPQKGSTMIKPGAFLPKCAKGKPATGCSCRACTVAAAMVAFAAGCSSAMETAAIVRSSAPVAAVARSSAPPAAAKSAKPAAPAAKRAVSPAQLMSGRDMLDTCVAVGVGLVAAFQAIRETAHASQLTTAIGTITDQSIRILDLQATIATGQAQLDAARAGHAAQVAKLHQAAAPAAAAPAQAAPHTCARCSKPATRGYVFDDRVICRDCRGAESDAYHAARGTTRRPRTDRGRGSRVDSMTVHAASVTVAAS